MIKTLPYKHSLRRTVLTMDNGRSKNQPRKHTHNSRRLRSFLFSCCVLCSLLFLFCSNPFFLSTATHSFLQQSSDNMGLLILLDPTTLRVEEIKEELDKIFAEMGFVDA